MTALQWRRFNFFDIVKNPDNDAISKAIPDSVDICGTAFGQGFLYLGDTLGNIHSINQEFVVSSFKAFTICVSKLFRLRYSGFLLALGSDEENKTLLKVFNYEKSDKNEIPYLSRWSLLHKTEKVSCFSVHDNQGLIAIGFHDGSLLLMIGDIISERNSVTKLIHRDKSPISGLIFRPTNNNNNINSNNKQSIILFVSSETSTWSFSLSPYKNGSETKLLLDSFGCCHEMSIIGEISSESYFITCCSDAIYCYTPEHRAQCYAFTGLKNAIFWFRNYLILSKVEDGDKMTLSAFDVTNKFIGFTVSLKDSPKALLSEWGSLFALTKDKKLLQFKEKDTCEKLNVLFIKKSYDIALKIAKSQHMHNDDVIDIFRQYGDYFYSKGDHEGAIENYIKTVGTLEPSYVICRYLDTHRISYLIRYLEALHHDSFASEDHTTLLLNCYTKLKDESTLSDFIMTKDRKIDFNVEIAIHVCRSANYFSHALTLAFKHKAHDSYLRIQCEDLHEYKDAIVYMASLTSESAISHLMKYGELLMTHVPIETTELLIQLIENKAARPSEYLHLFMNNSSEMIHFLERVLEEYSKNENEIDSQNDESFLLYNALLEIYLRENKFKEAILLLKSKNYDEDQALLLCTLHKFHDGILFLYERKRLYSQILRYNIEEYKDLQRALQTCVAFGAIEPSLWTEALTYFSKENESTSENMSFILSHIEKHNLMSPLSVLQTLSQSENSTIGLVQDYLVRFFEMEERELESDLTLIEQYKVDTEKIKRELSLIQNEVTVFQVSKCDACNQTLELPALYFLCKHSYHAQCFQIYSESDKECPLCSSHNKKILDIIASQEEHRNSHDAFHFTLNKSEDGFGVVADYFGRGMFRKSDTDPCFSNSFSEKQPIQKVRQQQQQQHLSKSVGTEGRLLQTSESLSSPFKSEGRLRAESKSEAHLKPVSDARLRVQERNRSLLSFESPSRNPFESPSRNPFESPSQNLFESLSQNPFENSTRNPFETSSRNPFESKKESPDYDEKLNPFADI